ncbi:MAG: MAE_28990/MAE_18760 family HEPN-like nuclease, partial [Blastocatellales bacterium]
DANPWDVQQMLNRNGHRNAPWDDFDSPTPIYWGIPRRFPKTQIDRHRYKSLSTEQIIKDFHEAISGIGTYVVLPQALLRHDQNLRVGTLTSIFDRLGINQMHQWVSNHRLTRDFINNTRGGQNTIDAELDLLIGYRNDAAHGNVTDVLGKESLLEYCIFIETLCQAVYERVNHWVISRKLEIGAASDIGRVTEEFRNNVVVVIISNASIAAGDDLFFMGDRYCYKSVVESIQVNDTPHETVQVGSEQEIGFKTTIRVRRGARIIRRNVMTT